eukprot:10505281-Alexandrium_andersonii.AAC.1
MAASELTPAGGAALLRRRATPPTEGGAGLEPRPQLGQPSELRRSAATSAPAGATAGTAAEPTAGAEG